MDMTNRAKEIWDLIFCLLDIIKNDEPIEIAAVKDFNSQTTKQVLRIFSLDIWLHSELNKANHEKNLSKVMTLGPFARLINFIMDQPYQNQNSDKNDTLMLYKPIDLPKKENTYMNQYTMKQG